MDNPYRWVGIVQRDPNELGQFRQYKWLRSDVEVPNTTHYWWNRYLPSSSYPEACGHVHLGKDNSEFHDNDCAVGAGLICEY